MSESAVPKESALVEVSPQTTDIVKLDEISPQTTAVVAIDEEVSPQTTEWVTQKMPNAPKDAIDETAKLFEAIKNRAEAEWQTASELTRDAYLNAVRKAQAAIEQNQTQAKERIDQAGQLVQQEAEKNLQALDSIKTRAQEQVQSVSESSLGSYIETVRQARQAVEKNKLIERDRIEQAVEDIVKQTEKNWLVIFSEIESLSTRVAEAAKNAWNDLMAYLPKDKDSTPPAS